QNWADRGQMGLPGYRDRIVQVHHTTGEGGLNLGMPPPTIEDLAERGRAGALKLMNEFDFDQHRWTRYRTAMAELEEALASMRATSGTSNAGSRRLRYAPRCAATSSRRRAGAGSSCCSTSTPAPCSGSTSG